MLSFLPLELFLSITFLRKISQVKVQVPNNADHGLLVTCTGENIGCARIILQLQGQNFLDLSVLEMYWKQKLVFISVMQEFWKHTTNLRRQGQPDNPRLWAKLDFCIPTLVNSVATKGDWTKVILSCLLIQKFTLAHNTKKSLGKKFLCCWQVLETK